MNLAGTYAFDDFELDLEKLELTRGGQRVQANLLILRLLAVLVQDAGRIVTKQELLERVWDGRAVSDSVITVAVARLRKTLRYVAGEPVAVVNVHGRGYRFARPVSLRQAETSGATPAPGAFAFVGREAVLGHLRSAFDEARSGNGGVIILSGEAGIGKTCCAQTFCHQIKTFGLPVAWGCCREVGETPPLWPFAELLRELIAQSRVDPFDAKLAPHLPELLRLLPELATSARTDPRVPAARSSQLTNKHRIFDAVARTLMSCTQRTPCVLVLDDVHRADAASLELLEYLSDEIPRASLLLLVLIRSHAVAFEPALARVLGRRSATCIALPRLSEAQVECYLETVLEHTSRATSQMVFRYSEGNPFFMTELARQLRLHDPAEPADLRVPDAALDVVRQRLMGLDPTTREVLSCAAVIGRRFSLAVLQMVSARDGATVMQGLDRALESELVLRVDLRVTEFVFGHELLRSVLYDAMPAAERRSCHLRVLEALEQRASFETVAPADLAYHARAALPLGDLRKTVRFCTDACTAAAAVFAYADAARYLQYALETLDLLEQPSPRLRLKLLLQQALLTRVQSTREFVPIIARVVSLAREHGPADILARAAMLHDPYPGLLPLPGAVQALTAAHALLQSQPGEPGLLATMLVRRAMSAPLAFDAAKSSALLEQAAAIASRSSEVLDHYGVREARLYLNGGPAHRQQQDATEVELVATLREHPTLLSVPQLMLELHRAVSALQEGMLPDALAALERGRARSRDLDCDLLWLFERGPWIVRYCAGEVDQAVPALKALHERARRRDFYCSELFCAHDEALIFGTTYPLRPQLMAALEPQDSDRPNLWALKLRTQLALGNVRQARTQLARLPPQALSGLPNDRDWLGTLGSLARVACELQARDYAEALYALLAPYPQHFAVHLALYCEGSISQLLGALAQLLGRHAAARAHWNTAAELSQRTGLRAVEVELGRELKRYAAYGGGR